MKKYIIFLFIIAIASLGIGFVGRSIRLKNMTHQTEGQNNENTQSNESIDYSEYDPTPAAVDTAQETIAIRALVKSYLVSSIDRDWDTLLSFTTGKYKEQLEKEIIPQMEELFKDNSKSDYEINTSNIDVTINSLETKESIVTVKYIVTRSIEEDKVTTQEEIKIYLTKEIGTWQILSVEN